MMLWPLHILWELEEEIAVFSVIVAKAEAVHPQESVTVTLYEPAAKELMFWVVAPLFQA